MSRIRSTGTQPERAVAGILRRTGLRFRRHGRSLPGTPDFVLRDHRAVVFVHGCFWHRHEACPLASTPRTRRSFWKSKFHANVRRDARNARALRALGWRVLVVWECALETPENVGARLSAHLRPQLPSRGR